MQKPTNTPSTMQWHRDADMTRQLHVSVWAKIRVWVFGLDWYLTHGSAILTAAITATTANKRLWQQPSANNW